MRKTNSLYTYKRILSVILSLAVLLLALPAWSMTARAAGTFAGGDGSEDTPYLIETAEQLKKLAEDVNSGTAYEGIFFKLTKDIDLGGSPWTPIGTYAIGDSKPFSGTFDGCGHMISGLYIDSSDDDYQGLFGYVHDSTIKNLGVDGNVTGHAYVGSVVGYSSNGMVENCYNTGHVTATGQNCGGVVGFCNYNNTVKNCYNTGTVSGWTTVGGIVGQCSSSTVENCYNIGTISGTISGTTWDVGGVVGSISARCTVQNCYNIGDVSGSKYVGGVVGRNNIAFDQYGTVQNCFFLNGIASQGIGSDEDAGGTTGISTAQFAVQSTFTDVGWDFDTTWKMSDLLGRPIIVSVPEKELEGSGTSTAPYIIKTAEELALVATLVNGGNSFSGKFIKLANDIDLSGVCGANIGSWSPIGNESNPFSGTFDGGGHIISGLYINTTAKDQGLFGCVTDGTIQNLGVAGSVTVEGNYNNYTNIYIGGVVGLAKGSTIKNCFNTSKVSGGALVGGVVGYVKEGCTVQNCYNSGEVGGGSYYGVGGVVGSVTDASTVQNCYNTGKVSGPDYIGGVAGGNWGTIQNCYNTGDISGETQLIGGVAGINGGSATIENCYNTGKVSGTSDVGGVAGSNDSSATIENCYNTGKVSGLREVGGVVGWNDEGTTKNCYNTGNVSGTSAVGGVVGYNDDGTTESCYYLNGTASQGIGSGEDTGTTGIDAAEFAKQTTFTDAGWNFSNIWIMSDLQGRPLLKKLYVTLNYNNGTTEEHYVDHGIAYGELPTPARDGFTFDGWYTQPNGQGEKITEATKGKIAGANTLYANWTTAAGGDGNTSGGSGNDNTGNTGGSNTGDTSQPSTGTIPPSTPATGDTNDPSGDTSEPSTGDNTEPSDGNNADNVNIGSVSSENAPEVTISEETSDKLKEEIIASLTDEERAAIENGDTLDVILKVENAGENVPAEDRQAIEAVLTNTEYTVGMYLNIDLIKLINGQQVGKITEINSPIRVTIEIPKELRRADRAFAIVRVHNGAAEILEDTDNDPDTITIVTDKFSTYSIAYHDTEGSNPDTGTTTPIAITGLACAVIIAAVAVKRKKITE